MTLQAERTRTVLDVAPVFITERPPCGKLAAEVVRMFGHRLDRLHEWPYLGDVPGDVSREQDQGSRAHAQFYRLFPRIADLYMTLAAECVHRFVGRPAYVQAVPTFRVHFPGSRAVGEPHTDWQYGHQVGEVTCWLPLTRAERTAALWVGDRVQDWNPAGYERALREDPAAADDQLPPPVKLWPVNIAPPLMLVFDSARRVHANMVNREGFEPVTERDDFQGLEQVVGWAGRGVTRVSLDFRLLPAELHEPGTRRRSVNTAQPMRAGGYWTAEPVLV